MPKGRIVVDEERCKGCSLCTTACPHGLIYLNITHLNDSGYHPATLIDPAGQCTGCGLCAVICPDACLRVYRVRAPRSKPVVLGVN